MSESSAGSRHQFEPLSATVIAACIDVQRQLGIYCQEEDYQRALEIALPKFGLHFKREVEAPITYDGHLISPRRMDFVVWDDQNRLMLETKAVPKLQPKDVKQSLRNLEKSDYPIGLLINFGERPIGIRRFLNTPK